ncbi:MurR/RpiR family transcriptional regulator [Erysipelothrix sp. HDW6A]|uniref:MurR/RpiR family transcriptional regulator n=1 Tax=Erysipelothrix sp. HDW6A TaxID=2714928 RepID=UPI00140B5B33|nr:MurR/RpiR family transcriptional regulator [Erysipelothrix sp. HDW6A]QIK57828.1 MurR/RpiR family transcriptional regulator [Erysipelothrix sp. HDW6A]
MLLIHKIQNFDNLSETEIKISEYILTHQREVSSLTIQELANATFTSPATITRYCRKMGTEGFSDFKLRIARELSSHFSDKRIHDDVPFVKDESESQILENILALNFQSMQDTYNILDQKQLSRVARKIHEAPHTYLYGTGQSLILCQDFQYKLFRIEKDCNLESMVGFQYMKTLTQPQDSVTIMVSYYGVSRSNLALIQSLRARGLYIVLITGPKDNPLVEYADEVIHVAPQETLIRKMASFSSRTSIQLVLDLLYALIFSFDYERYQKLIEEENM